MDGFGYSRLVSPQLGVVAHQIRIAVLLYFNEEYQISLEDLPTGSQFSHSTEEEISDYSAWMSENYGFDPVKVEERMLAKGV